MSVGPGSVPQADRRLRLAVVVGVGGLHLGLIAMVGLIRAAPTFVPPPPIFDIVLSRPAPPLPAPPQEARRRPGGGAPAAPSRIHTPPDPPVEKIELPAPRELAPQQALIVGMAPIASPQSGLGQGGVGTGLGSGVGPGDGPGSGGGTGPVLIRGPHGAVMTRSPQRIALTAPPSDYAVLRCFIRLNQRLTGCRVLEEYPTGSGAGKAALARAREIRFAPPTVNGRPRDRTVQTIAIKFPPKTPAETVEGPRPG